MSESEYLLLRGQLDNLDARLRNAARMNDLLEVRVWMLESKLGIVKSEPLPRCGVCAYCHLGPCPTT